MSLLPSGLFVLVATAWIFLVNWEVNENVLRIDKDGARNSLHQLFHRQRKTIRGIAMVVLSCIPALAFWGHPLSMLLDGLSTFVYLLAYFVRTFNPRLNVKRELPYIDRFYVSFDPDAAGWPDKWIATRAKKAAAVTIASAKLLGWDNLNEEDLARQYASSNLQSQLNIILFSGIAVSIALSTAANLLK
jgi:hypothetical protein